jgi:hypothetical protein
MEAEQDDDHGRSTAQGEPPCRVSRKCEKGNTSMCADGQEPRAEPWSDLNCCNILGPYRKCAGAV